MTSEERAMYRIKKRQKALEDAEFKRRRKAESTDWLKKESENEGDKWNEALNLFRSERK